MFRDFKGGRVPAAGNLNKTSLLRTLCGLRQHAQSQGGTP
jgi:hypothetical protein